MSLRSEEGGPLLLSVGCWWWAGVEEVGGHGTALVLDVLKTASQDSRRMGGKDDTESILVVEVKVSRRFSLYDLNAALTAAT